MLFIKILFFHDYSRGICGNEEMKEKELLKNRGSLGEVGPEMGLKRVKKKSEGARIGPRGKEEYGESEIESGWRMKSAW